MTSAYGTFSSASSAKPPPDHPLLQASWLSRLLLHWVSPLIALGNERHLTEQDMWPLQPELRSRTVAETFSAAYAASHSLSKAFLHSFRSRVVLTGIALSVVTLCSLIGPVVLNRVVSALTSNSYDANNLAIWILILFASQSLQAVVDNYACFDLELMAIQFTGAIKHALYRKSLLLNAEARRQKSVGEITSHYTMDCDTLARMVSQFHWLWLLPLQILVVCGMLYWLLGVASLAGIATVALIMRCNDWLSFAIFMQHRHYAKAKDERMKRVTETFRSIGMVKFNAWEDTMAARISDARNVEVDSAMKYFKLEAVRVVISMGMPVFISVATFAVYAGLLHHELSPALVFTSLSLFQLIQQPLNQLAGILATLTRAQVSAGRIEEFLALPELDLMGKSDRTTALGMDSDLAINVVGGKFTWDSTTLESGSSTPLQCVNLEVHKGDLVVLHGPVGSGKSSLCSAILGEMEKLHGSVGVNGSIAYCSQEPWIQNLTLRDNILFGLAMDNDRYAAVLDACALTHDLDSLPSGDLTEIGERGVNLSGGQKARVALARACYTNADIYILDAPLATVDAIVQNEIFNKCVLGLLRHKTVLLVTHSPEIIASKYVTTAITVSPNGSIVETASRHSPRPVRGVDSSIPPLPRAGVRSTALLLPAETTHTLVSEQPELSPKLEAKLDSHRIVHAEKTEQGRVRGHVLKTYYTACGGFAVVAAVLFTQGLLQGLQFLSSYWLGVWSTRASENISTSIGLGIFVALAVLSSITVFVHTLVVFWLGLRAGRTLFDSMTHALLYAPMGFFDATPIGRLLGRYSEDVGTVDRMLPMIFSFFLESLFFVSSSLLIDAVIIQWKGILLLPLVVLYVRLASVYIAPAREVERWRKTTWSPILSHLAASVDGAAVVRAFGGSHVQHFQDTNDLKLDTFTRAKFVNLAFSRWFVLRTQLVGCGVVLVVTMSLVLLHDTLGPVMVGLAFTYALPISQSLENVVQLWSGVETRLVSPERIQEYTAINQEKPHSIPTADEKLPPNWPANGVVELKNVGFRYNTSAQNDLVLRNISFHICSGEKIGIVGRTGAGKSSLTMALFRINELATGSIHIDGVDISSIGLKTLREKISIIPQNPVLFNGPLRASFDPFSEFSDDDLWRAIERVGLMERIRSEDKKLECVVDDKAENFSVGERQMLCMARALLRQSRIVIFDEATASIDHETDRKLQLVIREAFAESTVLTIAHRLVTVLDSNRILVMDAGQVVEFAPPAVLVSKGRGHFYELMQEAGCLEKVSAAHK